MRGKSGASAAAAAIHELDPMPSSSASSASAALAAATRCCRQTSFEDFFSAAAWCRCHQSLDSCSNSSSHDDNDDGVTAADCWDCMGGGASLSFRSGFGKYSEASLWARFGEKTQRNSSKAFSTSCRRCSRFRCPTKSSMHSSSATSKSAVLPETSRMMIRTMTAVEPALWMPRLQ